MQSFKRQVASCLIVLLLCQPCWAWSEGGHHLIAKMAFDLLSPQHKDELQRILARHPRFADDFRTPANIQGAEDLATWRIGRAGYWPDVARSQPDFNRPTWHYQLGATLTLGDGVTFPAAPGPLPADANLATQELHIGQAVQLCRQVLRDKSLPDAQRALAVCWLVHLVADAHQPCHAGSLYAKDVFPEGDRGANSIPVMQGRNLHSLWDDLLGPKFNLADNRRRAREIQTDAAGWDEARLAASTSTGVDPLQWLTESREYGRSHVYTSDVLNAVGAARRAGTNSVAPVDLSVEYLQRAGALAQRRAAFAAHRLATVVSLDDPATAARVMK